jgi:hypothetical protein
VPTPFAITAAAPSVRLDDDRTGAATFTVSNTAAEAIRAEARIWTKQPEASSWMRIDGLAEQEFPPGASRQFTVRFTPPATVPAGSYAFRVDLISRERPDDDSAMGQVATVEVPPPPVTPKPRTRFPWWLLVVAVVVLVVAGLVIRACTAPGQVTVPNVVGRNLDAARAALERANLTPGAVTTREGSGEPVNTVLEQVPAADSKVREGDRVDLVVAVGASGQPTELVAVPEVKGLSRSDAETQLQQAKLTLGGVRDEPTGINQPGTVHDQDPPATTRVRQGQAVSLVVEAQPLRSSSSTLVWVLDRLNGRNSRRPMLDLDTGTVHKVGIGQAAPDGVDVMLIHHGSANPAFAALVPQSPATIASTGANRIDLRQCLQGLSSVQQPIAQGANGCLRTDQGRVAQFSVPGDIRVESEKEPGTSDFTTVTVTVSYTVWAV